MLIDEAVYNTRSSNYITESEDEHLQVELLDIDKFIKVNELQEITNPIFFNGPEPTPDGLLSNEIFGITKKERSSIYAYISLSSTFLHPLVYKTLLKINNKIADIVNGTDFFSITDKGELVKDEKGHTGIDWLRQNFSKIKFEKNDSPSRNRRIKFINKVHDKMWIKNYIVIPASYRDIESKDNGIGVGEINKLYSSLLIATKSLRETAEYGLTLSDVNKARIQNILVQIFDWFGKGTTINGIETPSNLPGKTGLIKHGIMYKTVDYSTGLVMSSPDVSTEDIDDLMVDMDHMALPLASALCNFKPFIMFWIRRFFENAFAGKHAVKLYLDSDSAVEVMVPLADYQIAFSDIEIEKQIERFIYGYSNRFIPIELPVDKTELAKILKSHNLPITTPIEMKMSYKILNHDESKKYRDERNHISFSDIPDKDTITRSLTWCDIFFMAAVEVTKDKHVLATRFPFDSYLNQLPIKVRIRSTGKTVPVLVFDNEFIQNTEFYQWYPYIETKDLNTNTASAFLDTASICNGLINAMGMDYDGDTIVVKPIYTVEANEECEKTINSKIQMLGMNGYSARDVSLENLMVLYELTLEPDSGVTLINPKF